MGKRNTSFDRDIVDGEIAGPDGWADYKLSCGHRFRLLIGFRQPSLRLGEKVRCYPCSQLSVPETQGHWEDGGKVYVENP